MKTTQLALVILLTFNVFGQQKYFTNPVIGGFNPDPSICRNGDDYYLVTSSFEFFPGVPVYHSKDLVNWKMISYALTRNSQLNLTNYMASDGIWAPTIRYCNGKYYIITTLVSRRPWQPKNFYVTATDPTGPWSDPILVDEGGIDPDLFFDDNGKTYYLRNGGNGIDIAEIDLTTGKLVHAPVNIWAGTGAPYPEAPHLYKINGMYYLIIAEGGTGMYHQTSVARASSPLQVFKPYPHNPILCHTQRHMHTIQATGHADIIQAHDQSWWAVFLGKRSAGFEINNSLMGRETFLAPVNWTDDGWPIVGSGGFVELKMQAPAFFSQQQKSEKILYDFSESNFPLAFNHIRNPVEYQYTLTEKPGWAGLAGCSTSLSDAASPTFAGVRLQHVEATVTVKMDFSPTKEGEEAGITIYLDNKHYYSLSVIKSGKKSGFQVHKKAGSIEMKTPYSTHSKQISFLRLQISNTEIRFLVSVDGQVFNELETAEAKMLYSPQFTGAFVGIYATGNGNESKTKAWFDYFEYTPEK